MPAKPLIPFDEIPREILLDQEGIRQYNKQRFEMEQVTAITSMDYDRRQVTGFRDYRPDEFWVRGHFPGHAMVPGVLLLEAAAQICSVYVSHFKLINENEVMAFGGVDEVRFRGEVRPGQRLWLVGIAERNTNRRMLVDTQGFVDGKLIFEARVLGMALRLQTDATHHE